MLITTARELLPGEPEQVPFPAVAAGDGDYTAHPGLLQHFYMIRN